MIKLGEYNNLEIIREVDFGVYLTDGEVDVLLPMKWVPEGAREGDSVDVFIFRDSEDRLIATTVEPYALANTFAFLEVKQVNETGAFLDWGIDKDLMVPFREQANKMQAGRSYIVYVYVDEETNRLAASSKLNKFFEQEQIDLQEDDVVDLLIYAETELGYNAIINNLYRGLIYKNEVYERVRVGDKVRGFVKAVREDNKIDLRLQKSGFELVDNTKWRLLDLLKNNKGFLPLSDNSTPEEIKEHLQVSKKAFKKAVGALYKERLIEISDKGITLKENQKPKP